MDLKVDFTQETFEPFVIKRDHCPERFLGVNLRPLLDRCGS